MGTWFSPSLFDYFFSFEEKCNRLILIYQNSYLAARLGGIKQNVLSRGSITNNTFLLVD